MKIKPKISILEVKRVEWGSPNTPYKEREYKLVNFTSSLVGTVEEWLKVAAKNKYDKVRFTELNSKVFEQFTDYIG